jgi:hypothetical protein
MKRIFLAAVFQLLAAAAIIISLQPCLALFAGASQERQGYYEHVYWNYLVIRSWLAALAGITIGVVLFWISGRIKSKGMALRNKTGSPHFSIKRVATIVCLVVGAILAFAFLPGLSSFFGKNALDYHTPMEVSPKTANGMIFMIMSNDLTTPHVELHLPDSGIKPMQLMLNTNAPGSW